MSASDSELHTTSNLQGPPACPICYDICLSSVNLKCNHTVCLECFMKSINHINIKCPLCRDLISEAEPVLQTFNRLLHDTNTLMERINNLNNDVIDKNNTIHHLKEIISEKDDKIDDYRDAIIDLNKQNITLLNKLLDKIEEDISQSE